MLARNPIGFYFCYIDLPPHSSSVASRCPTISLFIGAVYSQPYYSLSLALLGLLFSEHLV